MKKLHDLRAHLLASPLGISADKLLTFAESGRLISNAGMSHQNQAFAVKYQAHVIITDFAGEETALMFVLTRWLHQKQPSAAPDAIAFQIDIISHQQVDVSFRIDLEEVVAVKPQAGGTELVPLGDGNALFGSLFGVITRE